MINYDGKRFASKQNTENGEVSSDTVFLYHQKGNIVWAEYSGGSIKYGSLIAIADEDSCLEMRYQHINEENEFMTGICYSKPEILPNGKLRIYEEWQWTCKDYSKGNSIIEEI